jgi:hypothetical protein
VLLHFPRRDLLRYASLRYVARALSTWLTFGADEPETRVPYGDPAFQRLNEVEKARRIDAAFEQFVALRALAEEKAEEAGVFSAIHHLRGKGDADLSRALRATLGETWRRLDELITLQPVDPMGINPGNPSIHRTVANLRDDATKARTAVRLFLEAQVADLRSGRFFERFFTEWQVNPIAQRLLLVRALRGPITPAVPGDADETDADYAFLAEAGAPVDFDGELVRAEVDKRNQELSATASPGLLSRLTDRDNAAFQAAKRKAVTFVQGLENDLRDELKRTFWRALESELRKVGETMLQSFRKVAEISDDAARLAHSQAERFQADPASSPDSEIGKMYLDAEALRDDRRKQRLWSQLYTHLLDKDAYLDAPTLFGVVTAAFQPVRDPDGRSRPRDAAEIVRAVQEQLGEIATRVYARALDDQGLDLARALDLEARYIALLDQGQDLDALRRQARLDDAVRAVPAARVRASIEERLGRVANEAVLLAHLDATRRDDPTVTPADVLYAGLHDRHTTDDAGSLGGLLRGTLPGVNFVQGWKDADSLVLYRAVLGVPLYWFKNVSTVLEPAYRHVMADPHRTYPLHIEAEWERDAEGRPGLPDLDPVQVKAAEQRRKAEAAARQQADAARSKIRQFNLVQLAGGITVGEAGYAWALAGATGPLGHKRHQAFQAFFALDPTLRDLLVQQAQAAWDQRTVDRRARAALAEEIAAHQARLTAAFAAAVAADDDAEKRFLAEERDTLAALASAASGEARGG